MIKDDFWRVWRLWYKFCEPPEFHRSLCGYVLMVNIHQQSANRMDQRKPGQHKGTDTSEEKKKKDPVWYVRDRNMNEITWEWHKHRGYTSNCGRWGDGSFTKEMTLNHEEWECKNKRAEISLRPCLSLQAHPSDFSKTCPRIKILQT